MGQEIKAQPKKKVPRKTPANPKPEPIEDTGMKPTKFEGQRKIGAPDQFVTSVGLGNLKVITNGKPHKYQ